MVMKSDLEAQGGSTRPAPSPCVAQARLRSLGTSLLLCRVAQHSRACGPQPTEGSGRQESRRRLATSRCPGVGEVTSPAVRTCQTGGIWGSPHLGALQERARRCPRVSGGHMPATAENAVLENSTGRWDGVWFPITLGFWRIPSTVCRANGNSVAIFNESLVTI